MAAGDPDLVLTETGLAKLTDGCIRVAPVFEDTDHGRTLLGCRMHDSYPDAFSFSSLRIK
jgi:hypothetical protein